MVECTEMENLSGPNSTCEDTTGSYICICNQDWDTVEEATRTEQTRTDVDECANNTHNCSDNAGCTNTDEDFACTCKKGYTCYGITCEYMTECSTGSPSCNDHVDCENTNVSYTCTFVTGYYGEATTAWTSMNAKLNHMTVQPFQSC